MNEAKESKKEQMIEEAVSGENSSSQEARQEPSLIEELKKQVQEKENKYLYLYADFENFKKRARLEKDEVRKFGWESFAREILGVLDNLERALEHHPDPGVEMTAKLFKSTLEKYGVQTIPSVGQKFDPNLHEALGEQPSDKEAGTILKEETRGYTMHGRLLRAPKVWISSGKS